MPNVWAITGLDIPASSARSLVYVASGGARGVAAPGDCKVSAQPTPTTSVRVAQGGVLVPSTYGGSAEQTYALFSPTSETVPISATTSAGARRDLIVARVCDNDYETGTEAGSYSVIQGVSASVIASRGAAVNYCKALPYPAEPLAGITIPASTATITNEMITDLRALARPRSQRWMDIITNTSEVTVSGTTRKKINTGSPSVEVPAWANRVRITCTLTDLYFAGNNPYGILEIRFGDIAGPDTNFNVNSVAGNEQRLTCVAAHEVDVSDLRGTTQTLSVWAQMSAGAGSGANIRVNTTSQFVWDVYFTEAAN